VNLAERKINRDLYSAFVVVRSRRSSVDHTVLSTNYTFTS